MISFVPYLVPVISVSVPSSFHMTIILAISLQTQQMLDSNLFSKMFISNSLPSCSGYFKEVMAFLWNILQYGECLRNCYDKNLIDTL
jgi:hypothetical protein